MPSSTSAVSVPATLSVDGRNLGELGEDADRIAQFPEVDYLVLTSGRVDVLHCTTFRGPLRASVPFTVTLHDLALVRHPELFPRWHRLSGRAGIGKSSRSMTGAPRFVHVTPSPDVASPRSFRSRPA